MNFLEELQKLRETQPRLAIVTGRSTNSDYSPYGGQNMNCYLCIGNGCNWDCYYIYWPYKCEDCCDGAYLYNCRLCYECVNCERCYNCDYCEDCIDTYDAKFCYDCINCSECIGCVGLRHQKFHIFNKPYTREEYMEAKKKFDFKNPDVLEKISSEFEKLKLQVPRLYMHLKNNENCIGDYIYNSCNAHYCWDVNNVWDCGYCNNLEDSRDCYDSCFGGSIPNEMCYECMSLIGETNCNFCNMCWYSGNLEYCELCFNCTDCFGCISLNAKKYHILNKPYSEEDYFKKVVEIKSEMREQGIYGQHLASDYPEFLAVIQ